MAFTDIMDICAAILLIVGAVLSLFAALGLLRLPDLLSRMHAATKPQVLGLLCLLLAIAIEVRRWEVLPVLIVAWIFQLLTAPVSAHMVGRAGYRARRLRRDLLTSDDLNNVVERAARAEEEERD